MQWLWIIEEIKEEIKKKISRDKDESKMVQNLQDAEKALL